MTEAEPILITGVGRRLGLHLANCFLQRQIPVIGTYRTDRPSIRRLQGLGADLRLCDFTKSSDINLLTDYIIDRYSRLRAIIHNASDWASEQDEAEPSNLLNRMIAVHVGAPYEINRLLAPLLKASQSNHADIVHITDYVASKGSKKHIAYAASKAAQDNLTLSFSARLAPKIKVNSIAPALLTFHETDDEEYRLKAANKNVMAKAGGADELIKAVDYLLGSEYVTGRILHMDGGRNVA